MGSLLVAKMSVREAEGRFNLPKSSLQDKISKAREGSKVQVQPIRLHWRLPNEPRCFCDLDYFPSFLREVPQTGEDFAFVDEFRV
jgi:hypothetical protein